MTNPSHVVPDSRTASLSTWWIPLRSDRQVGFLFKLHTFSNYVRNDHYDQLSVRSMIIMINNHNDQWS